MSGLSDERRAEMDASVAQSAKFHVVTPCGTCPRCLLADALAEVDRLRAITEAAERWNATINGKNASRKALGAWTKADGTERWNELMRRDVIASSMESDAETEFWQALAGVADPVRLPEPEPLLTYDELMAVPGNREKLDAALAAAADGLPPKPDDIAAIEARLAAARLPEKGEPAE